MTRVAPEVHWPTIVVSVVLFLLVAWLTDRYEAEIAALIAGQSLAAAGLYLVVVVAQVIIAPINTSPLVPLASAAWGSLAAVAITLAGWTIGSAIVFWLVRRYGAHLAERVVSPHRLKELQRITPTVATVTALRLLVPIDLLSYALAFVPHLTLRDYLIGTVIGYLPYAFLYAYLGDAPFVWQLVVLVGGLAIIMVESPRWFHKLTRS